MRAVTFAAVALAALAACSSGERAVEVSFDVPGGPFVVRAEVADTPAARARGLMHRSSLPADAGMLFLFDDAPAARTFHMLDTLIPLDLVSIRAGRVVGIQSMVPCPTQSGCPETVTPPADAVLELNAGTVARAGIEVGALVDSPLLR